MIGTMHQYSSMTPVQLQALQDEALAAGAECFEHAAQAFTGLVRNAFKDSSPLMHVGWPQGHPAGVARLRQRDPDGGQPSL